MRPSADVGAERLAPVEVPPEQEVVPRREDLVLSVAVEVRHHRRAEPRLVPTIAELRHELRLRHRVRAAARRRVAARRRRRRQRRVLEHRRPAVPPRRRPVHPLLALVTPEREAEAEEQYPSHAISVLRRGRRRLRGREGWRCQAGWKAGTVRSDRSRFGAPGPDKEWEAGRGGGNGPARWRARHGSSSRSRFVDPCRAFTIASAKKTPRSRSERTLPYLPASPPPTLDPAGDPPTRPRIAAPRRSTIPPAPNQPNTPSHSRPRRSRRAARGSAEPRRAPRSGAGSGPPASR